MINTQICDTCNKSFERPVGQINKYINKGYKVYCSQKCHYIARNLKVKLNCKNCGKSFEKAKNQFEKTKNHFCSYSCSATYNNKHRKNGLRVSKLEKYLQSKLLSIYPNLSFEFNKKDIINSELDIYIPSLKLAFELNGIFHYEPIYGEEKLLKIQNNDKGKFQSCIEKNISLCVIDTSSQKRFTEQSSQKFLNIITSIIDSKSASSKA